MPIQPGRYVDVKSGAVPMLLNLGLNLQAYTPPGGGRVVPTQSLFVGGGQSLMDYPFTRGAPRVVRYFLEYYRGVAGYPAVRNVAAYASSTIYHDGSSETASDWTVRMDSCASGGSQLLSWSNSKSGDPPVFGLNTHVDEANGFGGTGNYWFNAPGTDQSAITGNPLDDNSEGLTWSQAPLMRYMVSVIEGLVADGYRLNGLIWSQGTSDMSTDAEYIAAYQDQLINMIEIVRFAAANPRLPVFFHLLGTQYTSAPGTGAENIRQAQRNVQASMDFVYISGEEYPYLRATTRSELVSVTSGSATVTVANGANWGVNQQVIADELQTGTFISAKAGNVLTLQRRQFGVSVSAPATATNASSLLKLIDNVHLYPGSDGVEPVNTNTTEGFYPLFKASANFILQKLGFTSEPAQGPYVSSATVTRGTNVVNVNLTHVAGADFTMPNDSQGWRVTVDGVAASFTAVNKLSSTSLSLTLSSVIGITPADVDIQYAWGAGERSDYTRWVFDDAGYPMQARDALAVTIQPSSEVIAVGSTANGTSASSASAYTFSGLALGTAPVGKRFILVGIVGVASATTRTISSVTVGGVSAAVRAGTFKQQNNAGATGASYSAFYMAELPTGTSGDVVVTWNSTMARCGVVVWPLYTTASTPSVYDTESNGSTTPADALSVSLDTYSNGAAFGVSIQQGGTAVRLGGASLAPATTQTGLTVSATPASGDIAWVGLTDNVDASIATVTATNSLLNTVALAPF